MDYKANELSGASDLPANDHPVLTRATWRQDGPFIVDEAGKKIAQMHGEYADYEWHQRRVIAALNALQDIPTQYIEELLHKCSDNLISGLITEGREMATTLQHMEKRIAAHCREVEQLRGMMDACRVFEEQRAHLKQAPGAVEYEGLLCRLGLR